MEHVAPKSAKAVVVADGLFVNRKSEQYRLGLAQLKEWHEQCRARRLGIKRKQKGTHSVSAARHSTGMAKGGAK